MNRIIIKQSQPDSGRDNKTFRAYLPAAPGGIRKPLGVSASSTAEPASVGARACAVKAFLKFAEPWCADRDELEGRIAIKEDQRGQWIATLQPQERAGTTARDQIEAELDAVVQEIKAFKQAVARLLALHNQLYQPLSVAETSLRVLMSKRVVNGNEHLLRELASLVESINRINELKNTMDMGTLVIKTDRTMEAVWTSMP